MIQVKRGPRPDAGVYTQKTEPSLRGGPSKITRAERELQEAEDYYLDPNNFAGNKKLTDKALLFKVYKDKEVVAALAEAFGKKCAYCESIFAHVTTRDIEHFRPKGEVQIGPKMTLRPGYFWLAMEWDNLLVSCPMCNRAVKHEVPGQPELIKLGKQSQFPLADEARRLRLQGDLAQEETVRLLLNPCSDAPEEHLRFDEEGLIYPRTMPDGKPSPMGEASILVYALQRKDLVDFRKETLIKFREHFAVLENAIESYHANPDPNSELAKKNLATVALMKERIEKELKSTGCYLAMLRDWIRESDAKGEFALLKQFKIDPISMI